MKKFLFIIVLFVVSIVLYSCGSGDSDSEEVNPNENTDSGNTGSLKNAKCLTVYFSWSGHSKTLATAIQKTAGGELVEVKPTTAYTSDYNEMLKIATAEINTIDNSGTYPSIQTSIENFDKYDIVFVCTPLWWSRMSTPMQAFLHNHSQKLSKKKIALVVTSASSGISSVVTDAKRLCTNSTFVGDALWVRASEISNAQSLVNSWITKLGVK